MKRMFRLLFAVILVGVFAWTVRPQEVSRLNVSIKVDSPTFQRAQPAVVHAKINWGAVDDAQAKTLRAVSVLLTKPGTKENFCTRGDCLGATFSLPKQLAPKDGDIIEFDIPLDELHWYDTISSDYDFSQRKNMFEAIPAGVYYLTVSTYFEANYSTKQDPRAIKVPSNRISVEVR